MSFLATLTGLDTAKDVVNMAGKGISNILDRFIPKKMSDAERLQGVKDIAQIDLERSGVEVKDVNKAREMWMTFLRTQKVPWLARFLNSMFRPTAGFIALMYLTDKFWSQMITAFWPAFQWTLITRDPITDAAVTTIIWFFFGYRHKAKRQGLTNVG